MRFDPLRESDLPRLHAWLQRPHVAAWWHDAGDLAQVRADFGPMVDGTDTTRAFIAQLDDRPLGFIQCYTVLGSGDGWWEYETDPGARGIDQFLADEADLGRGLGRALIDAFVRRLFKDPAVTRVQADPSPANERAIRCYRGAGFADAGLFATPDGPAWLMKRQRG